MDDNLRWQSRQRMEKSASALEKNGFSTALFDSCDEAVKFLIESADGAESIGFGGSMTLAQLDLPGRLAAMGKNTLVHGRPGLAAEQRRGIMQQQLNCDLFLTSTNALTLKGQLVNIDATGNRVGAMFFGPKRVIVVAGANKITEDLDDALARIKNVAAPPNARRLGFATPCARTGFCSDCDSPQRICRITTILDRRPRATEMLVCLINESLGY
ncbi:MAG: lactate utilization protein C [Desulfuromonadaceae bacterium GWC2_58_13]|nr:MAG: lactate utilization protein C [Desulfuromonadaceae bacterium GWC2_58_13]